MRVKNKERSNVMEQNQNEKEGLETIYEGLKDALSLIIMLENDMDIEKVDEINVRVLKQVHRIIKNVQEKLTLYIHQKHNIEK